MQPVQRTAFDRLLTQLSQARQTGRLKAGQPLLELVAAHPWDDRVFAVTNGTDQYQVVARLAFNERLRPTYVNDLQRHGYAVNFVFGATVSD
ncbi:hypothetical protein [Lactiplantibacillus plajomi]|uniref:Uncharacterized protein n=1 Tax=Lactiplantibacillus plajomi TaxID=1457217 RepID=A0ABV6K1G7_9LACO|nr:hypothetical protein [Lactiplantibacillus plajomi]